MRKVLLWIWQLPQNIIGFVITRFCRKETVTVFKDINGLVFYSKNHFFNSAVSLGNYIIVDRNCLHHCNLDTTLKHEHGHQLQSEKLGWLYLLIIGLPSLFGNLIDRIFHKNWLYHNREDWYYSLKWEAWADKLGNVNRW